MQSTEFNLVHLTDFHIFQADGASWRSFMNKRSLSYLSWRLHRGRTNRPEVLTRLLEGLPSPPPDHVVVTGDLTHMGPPWELMQARMFLERIGPPDRVFVIPGNHDALTASSWAGLALAWKEFLAADHGARQLASAQDPGVYPRVRERNGVALIGLSSAVPTPPFTAAGRMGKDQCRRLAAILDHAGRKRLFRVVLVHHPIIRGQVKPRKSLRDAENLRTVLRRHGAELVLHGHTHRHSLESLDGPVAPIPVIGLPSATANHTQPDKEACLRVFSIVPEKGAWRINVRDYRPKHSGDGPHAAITSEWTLGRTLPNIQK